MQSNAKAECGRIEATASKGRSELRDREGAIIVVTKSDGEIDGSEVEAPNVTNAALSPMMRIRRQPFMLSISCRARTETIRPRDRPKEKYNGVAFVQVARVWFGSTTGSRGLSDRVVKLASA